MVTTYERGKLEGKLEGQRETALLQLQAKFGPLSAEEKRRVESMSPEQLRQLLLGLMNSPSSLKELCLED